MAPKTLVMLLLLIVQRSAAQARCATTCSEDNCEGMHIRYGKYCGLGHSGCEGQEPCDGVDACCKIHDHCVWESGLLDNKCNSELIACLKREKASKRMGFSKQCPYAKVIPIMENRIAAAIALVNYFKKFSKES